MAANPTPDTLDLIGSLIDKSLLRPVESDAAESRFVMLETIREFGLEQLAASGEEPDTRRRHAAYFLDLAVRADAAPFPEATAWLDRLEQDEAKLREAIACLLVAGEAADALRFAAAMAFFWFYRGRPVEGRGIFERVLEATRGAPMRAEVRAFALAQVGLLATVQCDTASAAACSWAKASTTRRVPSSSTI